LVDSDGQRAYSYVRFSSPEQAKGDSLRRQTALAAEYARVHHLILDESLSFHDLGVSAYHGTNSEIGKLGALLDAVKCGLISRNSVILVESLDRISRQAARKALRVLESIVEFGVSIVTLSDGREYTAESLDNDPINLLIALLTFIRANEESATKSQRGAAAWAAKRLDAPAKRLTTRCPGWLTYSKECQKFVLVPESARIVRRIFAAALAGDSLMSIARYLNRTDTPTLHGGGVRAKFWIPSGVSLILKNRAAIGTIIPHTCRYKNGKRVRTASEPILNYYPSVVSADTFFRAQVRKTPLHPLEGGLHLDHPIKNILANLGKCAHCHSAMITNSFSGNIRYLICRQVHVKAGCQFRTVRYHEIENIIIERFSSLSEDPAIFNAVSLQSRLDRIKGILGSSDLDRTAANTALRSVLSSVLIHPNDGKLTFNWKHGGASTVDAAFAMVYGRNDKPRGFK
jgi:DNA invertase Pin-like site-specific DNA recombinase